MKYLRGFKDYLDKNYLASIFETAKDSDNCWTLHLHDHKTLIAKVTQNLIYDVEVTAENQAAQTMQKTQIKFLYPAESDEKIKKSIKFDKKVKNLNLQPIITARPRYHIKNKTLFVLMKEKTVVFFTLLEGEIIRGLVVAFTRYDITVNLKGGVPITLLRHAIFDLRDKKGRSYLKSFQESHKDWKKSELYVEMTDSIES